MDKKKTNDYRFGTTLCKVTEKEKKTLNEFDEEKMAIKLLRQDFTKVMIEKEKEIMTRKREWWERT